MFAVARLVSSETAPHFQLRFRQNEPLKHFAIKIESPRHRLAPAETPRRVARPCPTSRRGHPCLLASFLREGVNGWDMPGQNDEEMIQANRNAP
jgi:hypothetical protein